MVAAGLNNNYSITPNVIESVARKKSPLPENEKIKILSVADLVDEIKNISATIRVIAEISKTNKQIEFHIIGHGKDEMMLKDLARSLNVFDEVVFFHGVKTNEEVFQYLYASQFLVMNSNYETFSLICIEAMGCGIPVIATRCGGPDEFINKENGILIEPGKLDELRHAIERMIIGYKSYDSSNLVRFATTRFSAEETGKKMDEIYIRLVAN
ncbi:MAG: glycosyltransferase [Bacteroidetes bacterium]|nr:glycosyltransferase [Bacteroidota bacterium]